MLHWQHRVFFASVAIYYQISLKALYIFSEGCSESHYSCKGVCECHRHKIYENYTQYSALWVISYGAVNCDNTARFDLNLPWQKHTICMVT